VECGNLVNNFYVFNPFLIILTDLNSAANSAFFNTIIQKNNKNYFWGHGVDIRVSFKFAVNDYSFEKFV
jgi:hypothetical protein